MDYQAFTNASLTMMYEGVRGRCRRRRAQATGPGNSFRVRETPEWKKHAAALEAEMLKRENVLRGHRLVRKSGEAAL